MKKISFFAILAFFTFALTPENHLSNQEKEARAMQLFTEIRCLVCEAQSIESSNTEFSSSMRNLIRQKIEQGKSNDEIKHELTKEFGNQILMSQEDNIFIFLIIFIALLGLIFLIKKYGFAKNS